VSAIVIMAMLLTNHRSTLLLCPSGSNPCFVNAPTSAQAIALKVKAATAPRPSITHPKIWVQAVAYRQRSLQFVAISVHIACWPHLRPERTCIRTAFKDAPGEHKISAAGRSEQVHTHVDIMDPHGMRGVARKHPGRPRPVHNR
jgi:hypothetical protein